MAYSIEELLANKSKIKEMSLNEIYKQYGSRDLLNDEINKRALSNIDEVREFYKNYNPSYYFGDYRKALNELCNLLKLNPIQILEWKSFIDINDVIATTYLNNDDSWLSNNLITRKISSKFLYDTLLKNNNLYKYPNLLELLPTAYLDKILVSNQIKYSNIPNLINLIKKSTLSSSKIMVIINRMCLEFNKNSNLIFEIMALNRINKYEIGNFIIYLQVLPFENYINFLNNLPPNIIQYINQDVLLFEKIVSPYKNNPDKLALILNSNFCFQLDFQMKKNLFFLLPNDKLFDILIINNEYYDNFRNNIYLSEFPSYFNENIDKCLNVLTSSHLLLEFFTVAEFSHLRGKIDNKKAEKFYYYILNNIEYLKFLIENKCENIGQFDWKEFIYSDNTNLNKIQQENILQMFSVFVETKEEIYYIFDKYPFIKDKFVSSKNLENYLITSDSEAREKLFALIDRYPEIIDVIDFNLITNIDSSLILLNCDKYSKVENLLMHNEKFLNYILSNENNILKFMPLINKYNISNSKIQLFNENFKKIQKVRPELSWGNSSLRPEMLHSDFINILGTDYIDAILQYDSEASDIVVDLYKQNKLNDLKLWLDYLNNNISRNHRMIHFYILSYNNMKDISNDLVSNNALLSDYQKQILEEIVDNNNLYKIKSLSELDKYFEIRVKTILNSNAIDVNELFLNTSSLQNGVPWKISFNVNDIDLDYVKYKFVDTDIITLEEYDYIQKIKNIRRDDASLYQLISEYIGKEVPTARSIFNKMYNTKLNDFNSKLLDLDELHKIASSTDPNSLVYIEIKDGIEYIHLNGYDFKCLACSIEKKVGNHNATFSEKLVYDFEQYRIFSEKIKSQAPDAKLSMLKIGEILPSVPESWDLIEGISTISTGVCSSRNSHSGYGWGKKSNVKVISSNPSDAGVSHKLRNLKPGKTSTYNSNETLYGNKRGEFFFDRLDDSNERIHPEFIISCEGSGEFTKLEQTRIAKTFGIPVVIRHSKYYGEQYENKLDLIARKKFLETYDVSITDDILFNHLNSNTEEKVTFLIQTLQSGFLSGILNYQTYISKLIDLKWKLYESGELFSKQMVKIDTIISEMTNEEIIEHKNSL